MEKEDLERLERMVDVGGLELVLYALGDICAAKADHLLENWQDKASAKVWSRRCVAVTRFADKMRNFY